MNYYFLVVNDYRVKSFTLNRIQGDKGLLFLANDKI